LTKVKNVFPAVTGDTTISVKLEQFPSSYGETPRPL